MSTPGSEPAIELRALGPDDWAAYRELRLAALDADPDAFFRSVAEEAAYDESVWRSRLGSVSAHTWLARCASTPVADANRPAGSPSDADRPVGTVTVLLGRPDVDAAELVGLWVAPAARGQGIGRQLVVEARDWVRSHGCARLTLWVADDNATARGLYAALGFRPTGETGAFPPPREHLREHEESLALPPHDHEDAPPS